MTALLREVRPKSSWSGNDLLQRKENSCGIHKIEGGYPILHGDGLRAEFPLRGHGEGGGGLHGGVVRDDHHQPARWPRGGRAIDDSGFTSTPTPHTSQKRRRGPIRRIPSQMEQQFKPFPGGQTASCRAAPQWPWGLRPRGWPPPAALKPAAAPPYRRYWRGLSGSAGLVSKPAGWRTAEPDRPLASVTGGSEIWVDHKKRASNTIPVTCQRVHPPWHNFPISNIPRT